MEREVAIRHEEYTLQIGEWVTVEKLERTYARYASELLSLVEYEYELLASVGIPARSQFYSVEHHEKHYVRRRDKGIDRIMLAEIHWTTAADEYAIVSFWLEWDTERLIIERNEAAIEELTRIQKEGNE